MGAPGGARSNGFYSISPAPCGAEGLARKTLPETRFPPRLTALVAFSEGGKSMFDLFCAGLGVSILLDFQEFVKTHGL